VPVATLPDVDVPGEWLDDATKAAFTDPHRSGIVAPVVVISATQALLGGEAAVFTHAAMTTAEDEVRWDVVALTYGRLVRTTGTHAAKYWNASDENLHRDPAPQVSASARPLADTVAVDLADVSCTKRNGVWEMAAQFVVTFADGDSLSLEVDHHDEVGHKFSDLMGLFSRALALPPAPRGADTTATPE
jgi:hypothetical protein